VLVEPLEKVVNPVPTELSLDGVVVPVVPTSEVATAVETSPDEEAWFPEVEATFPEVADACCPDEADTAPDEEEA